MLEPKYGEHLRQEMVISVAFCIFIVSRIVSSSFKKNRRAQNVGYIKESPRSFTEILSSRYRSFR